MTHRTTGSRTGTSYHALFTLYGSDEVPVCLDIYRYPLQVATQLLSIITNALQRALSAAVMATLADCQLLIDRSDIDQ